MLAPRGVSELEVLVKGIFETERFLDLVQNFIVFEVDGSKIAKKLAGYHQFHAVNKAIASTVRAASPEGDRRVGVVWHTQGSGKSLSMVFYAGKIIQHTAMSNPTLVILTDRNDLDDQLFDTEERPKQEEAVAVMLEKYEIASALFHAFDYSPFISGAPGQRLTVIPAAMEHILQQQDGKKRFLQVVTELSKAFVLAVPHEEALAIRDDVSFFQTVRVAFVKATPTEGKTQNEESGSTRIVQSRLPK